MSEPYTPTSTEVMNQYVRGWVTKRAVISRADESQATAEFDRFMSGYVRKPSREELTEVIGEAKDMNDFTGVSFQMIGSGEDRDRLADAILTLLERTDR